MSMLVGLVIRLGGEQRRLQARVDVEVGDGIGRIVDIRRPPALGGDAGGKR